MAIITKIREKSGVAILVVAVAMVAFILGGDAYFGKSQGSGSQEVGEIDGTEIDQQEFIAEVQRVVEDFKRSYGSEPQAQQMEALRTQVWNDMIYKYALQPQFDELGITVTDAEMQELLNGNNVSQIIQQNFRDPQTNQFDVNNVNRFLTNLEQNPNEQTNAVFNLLMKEVKKGRILEKYNNLFANTYYVTDAEAKLAYNQQNTKADVNYLYIPYATVSDSAVQITDSMLKDYYNKNAKKYDRDATRSIEYVSIPLVPSAQDIATIKEEAEALMAGFESAEDDTNYVSRFTTGASNQMFLANQKTEKLPTGLDYKNLEEGKVVGPIKEGDIFKLYKVLTIKEDSIGRAKASNIVIIVDKNAENKAEAEAEARTKAQGILEQIQGGASFAALARQHNTDNTKDKGGDLGWFVEGQMVKPFEDAVMNATNTGLINKLIKTDYGYHIIDVTGLKTNTLIDLAVLEQEIAPSQATINQAHDRAVNFLKANTRDELATKVNENGNGLLLLQGLNFRTDAVYINDLTGAEVKSIVRWAYGDDTDLGKVRNDYFEFEDKYVIATVIDKTEKGIAPFESVKQEVRTEVLNKAKAGKIIEKLKAVSGSMEEMVTAYGNGATTNSSKAVGLDGMSLKGIGFAPTTVGKIASMKSGETSAPFADETGVVIVNVESITPAVETADVTTYKNRIENRKRGEVGRKVDGAVKELAEIKNMLYKFF